MKLKSVFGDTSVVHQHVNGAEVFLDLSHHGLGLREVGGVSCICVTLYAKGFYFLACSLESGSHVVVEHEVCKSDVSSFLSKLDSNGLTDTARCTSDECSLA